MKSSSQLDELPVELLSFISLAQSAIASAEELTTAARALRALPHTSSSQTAKAQLALLSSLLSAPQARPLSRWAAYQAALSLLHTINTSAIHVTAASTSTLARQLTQALSAQSTSLRPDLRLALVLLRSLTTIATKVTLWPADATAAAADCIGYWAYYRPGAVRLSGPAPPDRGRADGGGAGFASANGLGGVMGSFAPAAGSKSKVGRSVSRSSSSSSLGRGWTDESDEDEPGDGGGRRNSVNRSAELRLEALSTLNQLATHQPRSLHPHWALFLADSPYLRSRATLLALVESDPAPAVRLRACAALQAILRDSAPYLAIAEDRPTKASFTSLSSRIGEIVAELHSKLTALLSSKPVGSQPELPGALLALAEVVGANAPYSRLNRPLAQPLANAVAPYLESQQAGHVFAACAALAAVLRNACASALPGPRPQAFDLTAVGEGCARLIGKDGSAQVRGAALPLLAALLAVPGQWTPDAHADAVVCAVEFALESEEAHLRTLGCEIASAPALVTMPHSRSNNNPLIRVMELARKDEDAAVQSAAIRALGLLVKSAWFTRAEGSVSLADVLTLLLDKASVAGSLTAAVGWSVANCCDLLDASSSAQVDLVRVADFALTVAASSDKALTDAVRMLGAVVRLSGLNSDESRLSATVDALCAAVSRGAPKTRWNAATAIGAALANPSWATTATADSQRLINSLTDALGSKSYKVRTQAALALMVPPAAASFGSAEELERVQARVVVASATAEAEEDAVPKKELAHWTRLVRALHDCEKNLGRLRG